MILPTFQLVASVVKQICVIQRQNHYNASSSNKLSKYNKRVTSAINLLCPHLLFQPLCILPPPPTNDISTTIATTNTIPSVTIITQSQR
uniref:Uncharacterized protein n=1 Tax=Glossina palpalis gambiensis TaxID=67801 RepID=A0A1B0C2I2_9MUSC